MVVDFLPVLKHREEVKSTRGAERHPYFLFKNFGKYRKNVGINRFCMYVGKTKTTIPISRTPKPINEFGLKPGKYRPSAVNVAGFDPLDANHAASTGVRPLPVLSLVGADPDGIRPDQGKEHNEQHPHR